MWIRLAFTIVAAVGTAAYVYFTTARPNHNGHHQYQEQPRNPENRTSGDRKRNLREGRKTVYEDIERGELTCPICLDIIRNRDDAVFCSECSKALHFRCFRRYRDSIGTCPYCRKISLLCSGPICMCGRPKSDWSQDQNKQPFTCGKSCSKPGCMDICHPGPCWNSLD